MNIWVRRTLPPLITLLLGLAVWQVLFSVRLWPPYLFPSPWMVLRALGKLVGGGGLWPSVEATGIRLAIGYLISLVAGAAFALVMARYKLIKEGVKPFLLGLQSLPSIAWVPLAILWFGFSGRALIFVTVVGSIFGVMITFTDAMATVPTVYLRAARNMGVEGILLVWRVQIPAAFPYLVSGAKQGWSFAWRSLIGAEIVFASIGLGFLLTQGREFLDVPLVIGTMIITLAIGTIVEMFFFSKIEYALRRRWGLIH